MLMSVRGLLRIELCVAFSKAGVSTCPSRSSPVAWATAVGRTRPTAAASCSGFSTTALRRASSSISRPSTICRSSSSRRSSRGTPSKSGACSGLTFRASSTRSPASALRSMPSALGGGRSSSRSVVAADVLTAGASARLPVAQGVAGGLAHGLRPDILVQALRDLDEEPRKQVAVGFHVAELGEHLLDRVLKIAVPALDFVPKRLRFLRQAIGKIPLELAELVRGRAQALFQRLSMLAHGTLDFLVGIRAQIFLLAELVCERLHLLLGVGFEGAEIARRLGFDVLEAL